MDTPGGGAATGAAAEQQASSLAAAADLPGSTDLNVHMAQEVASLAPEPWSKQETKTQVMHEQQEEQQQQQQQQQGTAGPTENSTLSQLPTESYKKAEFAAPPKGAVTIAGRRLATGEIPEGEVINLKDFPAGGHEEGSEGSGHSGSAAGTGSLAHALSDIQEVALTQEDTREAHNLAATAAASAAALVHIGEPVRRAVNVAEVALDPSATVDFDAAKAAGPEAGRDEQPLSPSAHPLGALDTTNAPPQDTSPGPLAHSTGELLAAHDASARAAAVAGALVHLGQPVPRAANMAEAAVEPADVVDFDSARTNAAVADTLPDILASHAAEPVDLGRQGQGHGQQQERQEAGVSPVLLTEESVEAAGLGIGDVEPEAVPPAAHAADPTLPMHTQCEHAGVGAAPAAGGSTSSSEAVIAAAGSEGSSAAGPAATSDPTLPPPPPPVAVKPAQGRSEAAQPHQMLVMKQVTKLQPGSAGSGGSSSTEAGAAAAEAAAAAAAQAAATAVAAAASGTDGDTPHEQDMSEKQKSAEQRQQERIAAMADMCRNAAALGLTDADALMEQQPPAVVEAIAVQLVEGSDDESGGGATPVAPVAVAAAAATAGGDDELPAAEAGSTAAATIASSSEMSDLLDAAAVLSARLPALSDPFTGEGGRAGNGLLPIDSGELPNAGMLLEQAFIATALRDASLSPRGAGGAGARTGVGAGEGRGSAGGDDGVLGGKGEDAMPKLPSLECLVIQDLGPGFSDPDQLPRVESGIATGIGALSAAAGGKGVRAGAQGVKKGLGNVGDADDGTDDRRARDQDVSRGRQGLGGDQQQQQQQVPSGEQQQAQEAPQAQEGDGGEQEGEQQHELGLLSGDVAIQGTAPQGSHRLKRARDHAAYAAAAAAGLVHAGQPLREAADLADVATAPSEFVDATAAHVRMHKAHGTSDMLASGADVEEDDGDEDGQGLTDTAAAEDVSINKTDLSMPLAVMASRELSDSSAAAAGAGAAGVAEVSSEAAGDEASAAAPAAADVASHNHAAKAAAAAAALHFAGVHVATAADVAEVATSPASAVDEDSGVPEAGPSTPSGRAKRHLLASGAVLHSLGSERSSSIAEGTEELPEWYNAALPAGDVTNPPGASAPLSPTPSSAQQQPVTPGTRILNTNSELANELLSAKGGMGSEPPGDALATAASNNASNDPQTGDAPEPLSVTKHQRQEHLFARQQQQQRQGQQAGEAASEQGASLVSDAGSSETAEALTPGLLLSKTYDPDIIAMATTLGPETEAVDAPQPLDNVSGLVLAQGLHHAASQKARLHAAPSPAVVEALGGLTGAVGATGTTGQYMAGEGSSAWAGSNVSTAGGSQASLGGLMDPQEEQEQQGQQAQQSAFCGGSSRAAAGSGMLMSEPVAYVIDEPDAAAERAAVLISKGSMAAIMQNTTSAAGVADAEAAAQSAAAALAGSTAEAVLGDEPGTQQGQRGEARGGAAWKDSATCTPDTAAAAALPPPVPFSKGGAGAIGPSAAGSGGPAGGVNLSRLASHGAFESVGNGGSEGSGHRATSLASVDIPALPAPDADVTAGAALMPDHEAGGDYEGVHVHGAHAADQGKQQLGEGGQPEQQGEQGAEQLHVQQGREDATADAAAVPLDGGSAYAHTQQAAGSAVAPEHAEQLHVLKGTEAPAVGDPASVPLGGGSAYAHTQQAVGGVEREPPQLPKLHA